MEKYFSMEYLVVCVAISAHNHRCACTRSAHADAHTSASACGGRSSDDDAVECTLTAQQAITYALQLEAYISAHPQ